MSMTNTDQQEWEKEFDEQWTESFGGYSEIKSFFRTVAESEREKAIKECILQLSILPVIFNPASPEAKCVINCIKALGLLLNSSPKKL